MKRIILPLLAVFLLFFALPKSALANCETVKIAYTHNWLPIAYDEEKHKAVGLGLAIQREIFQRLDQKIEFVPDLPWKRQLAMLERGDIDAMAAIYHNEERALTFDYTAPYHVTEIRIFKRADSSLEFTQLEDLIGYQGLASLGASFGTEFDKFDQQYLKMNRINGTFKIMELLRRGRGDFVVLPESLAQYLITSISAENEIIPSGPSLATKPVYMVFSKKSECRNLVGQVNATILQMKNEGMLARIIAEETSKSHGSHMENTE